MFRCCHALFRTCFFSAVILGGALRAHAAPLNYAANPALAGATINTTSVSGRTLPLSDVITFIEKQTALKFVYDVDRLPMAADVEIPEGRRQTLAKLLAEVSSQVPVIFKQRSGMVGVWARAPGEEIAKPEDTVPPLPGDAADLSEASAAPEADSDSTSQPRSSRATPVSAPLLAREGAGAAGPTLAPSNSVVEERTAESASEATPLTGTVEPAASEAPATNFLAEATSAPALTLPEGPSTSDVAPVREPTIQLDKFSVTGEVTKGSAADLRSLRKNAAVSVDFLSADQLAKYSAGDLSDVVFRMPGVSVAQGQFAVVRGLSDRFLSTTLQGIKLPSPDPEKQAVQLDLIPSSAVEAVVVSKTFEATQWAESSGGNMDVIAQAIPKASLLRISLGLKVNANAADGGPDYAIKGGLDERLGFGSRSRPAGDKADPTAQYIPLHRGSFPVGNKFAVEYAHAFNFGEQQLGVLVTAFSEATYKSRTGRQQAKGANGGVAPTPAKPATGTSPAVPATPGRPSDFEIGLPTSNYVMYDYENSESENVLGVTAGLGYRFSPDHELKLTALFVQSGVDQAQVGITTLTKDPLTGLPKPISGPAGFAFAEENAWYKSYEYFRERNLTVLQLAGRHVFESAGKLGVNWSIQRGTTYQKDAPFVEANFATPLVNLNKTYSLIGGSDSPQILKVLSGENKETQNAGRLNFDWPFRLFGEQDSKLSFGAAADSSSRDTTGTAIDVRLNSGGNVTSPTPNGAYAKALALKQGGIATPPTSAERDIKAYYATSTLVLRPNLKAVVGARYEDFELSSTGTGKWSNLTSTNFYSNNPAKGILGTNGDNNPPFRSKKWYPGIGLIYEPWKSLTIRLHYSKTDGRPSLREVSPFFNKSIETGNLVVGNPALKPASVTNYDLRAEWTPTRTDFVSVSLFRKDIENPIEKMLFSQTSQAVGDSTESWVNNPNAAKVQGIEFEFRHQFKSWSETLRDFSLSGNFTWIDATVGENPFVVAPLNGIYQDPSKIPLSRRLFDQPEYIANLDLTWAHSQWGSSATLAAYAISDVLSATGKPTFFDLYERAHTRLDLIFTQRLSAHFKLKLTVKNLTDTVRGLVYDRDATTELVERNRYRLGREFGLSVTADY